MPKPPFAGRTVGSLTFYPDDFFVDWDTLRERCIPGDDGANFRECIWTAFGLRPDDDYVYHAVASVNLTQVQRAINQGGAVGLHDWYRDDEGKPLDPPPPADIQAYTSIFSSTSKGDKALTTFAANAKKASLRMQIAKHLQSTRFLPPNLTIPKLKTAHINPSYDFWAWSCQNIEWAGPTPQTSKIRTSHHLLPVFMHHFGCLVPSFEALTIIKTFSKSQTIIDMGSGNGYWTYIMRRFDLNVEAVDNGESVYRTTWIGNTITMDGEKYLKKDGRGAREKVLLMVYPIVGAGFTERIMRAYEGDIIIVAGTQNGNGYTGFKDLVVDEWMKLNMKEFVKKVQVALPSFAGKDEALFIFERKAPADVEMTGV